MGQRGFLRLVFSFWALNALLPVVAMLYTSVTPNGKLGFGAYIRIFTSSGTWSLLDTTFRLAGATALASGIVGLPLSILLARTDLRARRLFFILFSIPILLPPVVLAYGWYDAVGRGGWISGLLGPSWGEQFLGFSGCVVILTASYLPVVLLFTATALLSVNPRLEEAGWLCAPPARVLTGITIPQIMPAFMAALLLVFCLALGETGASTFLRVNVYGVESLTQFAAFHDFATATAAAVPLLAVTLLAFLGVHRLASTSGSALQAVSLSGIVPALRLGRSGVFSLLGVALVWMVLAGMPLLSLVLRASDPSAYVEAIVRAAESFERSIVYSGLGASLIAGSGFLLGYGRARGELGVPSEALPLFLFALSGPVFGIGLTSLWNRPGAGAIYGTPLILLLGFLAQYTVPAVWITKATITMVPGSMEEAASSSRASWPRRLACIVVPLTWRGLAAAWLLAFVFCLRDTGLALAVYPPGKDPLPVRLFTLMANGRPEMISAVCVLLLLAVAIPLTLLGALFSRRRPSAR
jgi:iron(III) transport system permease protein